MKWIVASDLHGSYFYTKKLLESFAAESPDRLILLGDLLYHGPRNDLPEEYSPRKVIGLLNSISHKIICVRGNCDAEVDQAVLDFPIMSDYAILDFCGLTLFATHGHLYHKAHLPPLHSIDILLHGHSHIPACEILETNSCMYMNPGSVSIPKQDSPHCFMVLNETQFLWKTIEGITYHVWTPPSLST